MQSVALTKNCTVAKMWRKERSKANFFTVNTLNICTRLNINFVTLGVILPC